MKLSQNFTLILGYLALLGDTKPLKVQPCEGWDGKQNRMLVEEVEFTPSPPQRGNTYSVAFRGNTLSDLPEETNGRLRVATNGVVPADGDNEDTMLAAREPTAKRTWLIEDEYSSPDGGYWGADERWHGYVSFISLAETPNKVPSKFKVVPPYFPIGAEVGGAHVTHNFHNLKVPITASDYEYTLEFAVFAEKNRTTMITCAEITGRIKM